MHLKPVSVIMGKCYIFWGYALHVYSCILMIHDITNTLFLCIFWINCVFYSNRHEISHSNLNPLFWLKYDRKFCFTASISSCWFCCPVEYLWFLKFVSNKILAFPDFSHTKRKKNNFHEYRWNHFDTFNSLEFLSIFYDIWIEEAIYL